MYSGEDSSGDALSNKNLLSTWPLGQSCIMSNDRIDWAALAQQWIQMKESCSGVAENEAANKRAETYEEEQGEAPMEVVKDEEMAGISNSSCNMSASFANREWSSTWYSSEQSQLNTNWDAWSNINSNVQMPAVPSTDFFKNTSIPLLKSGSSNQHSELPPMDVAKKKTLPAWIREGLEKMEKEKQKQLEKLKRSDSSSRDTNPVLEETSAKDILQSGSEDSNSDHEKTQFKNNLNMRIGQEVQNKSKEEIAEELTLVVRKSLTELLLEVTNEEILSIAQESFRKYKSKASSAQVFRKSAISSITGKLGLGAYADSASESNDSESDSTVSENDSEEEIKENIRLRQNEFKTIAQDIEMRIRQYEEKQQAEKEGGNVIETPDGITNNCIKDSGETQPDKKVQSDDKRSKERTSRFSATKECKQKYNSYVVQATAIPCSSYDYNKRKAIPQRASYSSDSSSDNSSSYKKTKRRIRSREERNLRDDSQCGSNVASSDSDDYRKRRHYKSHTKERSRSRSHSRLRSHSRTSKRSEKRY